MFSRKFRGGVIPSLPPRPIRSQSVESAVEEIKIIFLKSDFINSNTLFSNDF